MSTTPAVKDPGCAVDTDGNLKDASEIEWHYDKDDVDPMPGPSSSSNPTTVSSFFSKKPAPTTIIAGSCWSTHTARPSARVLDPENAMNAQKQKAPSH